MNRRHRGHGPRSGIHLLSRLTPVDKADRVALIKYVGPILWPDGNLRVDPTAAQAVAVL